MILPFIPFLAFIAVNFIFEFIITPLITFVNTLHLIYLEIRRMRENCDTTYL